MPSDLLQAIAHATTVLGWIEHLTEDDMPPMWMWPLSHELEHHFEMVNERRKSGSSERDPEDGPMIRNEYARGRGREAAPANV